MAVKTITIDLEAYETLVRYKNEGQSFSQVIKQHFAGPRRGRDLLRVTRDLRLSPETLDRVEDLIRARGEETARAVRL